MDSKHQFYLGLAILGVVLIVALNEPDHLKDLGALLPDRWNGPALS